MGLYYNGKKVRNLYYNGKCITRLALGKEMTRLVEGDDFVRAQWLKGDGTAYIDTLVGDLTNVKNIYCKIKKPSDVIGISDTRIFGREPNAYPGTRLVVNFTGSYTSNITLWTASANVSPTFTTESGFINIDLDTNIVTTHQSSITFESYSNKSGLSIALFAVRNSSNYFGAPYKGSIGEFTIDELMQFIPCRLLRPIPAALDANGIARNADECGMYNLVNGLFYGNVANGGSFSVSDN